MYRKTFTLYQHTPLIHFQGDQQGATLRATQVKPQLDRFLMEAKKREKETIPEDWWAQPKDQRSLNYRLKIIPGEQLKGFPNYAKDYSNYFGDPKGEAPRQVTCHQLLRLVISTPNKTLKTAIEVHLSEFFYQTNFGIRSSKGFGSFSLGQQIVPNYVFKFAVADKGSGASNFKNLFRHIEFFHRSLRTGLNCFKDPETKVFNRSFYMKPAIFSYATEKKLVWEKKAIKEIDQGKKTVLRIEPRFAKKGRSGTTTKNPYSKPDDGEPWPAWYPDNESEQQKLTRATVRDVFGLSTDQKWDAYNFTVKKEAFYAGKKPDQIIERGPSPLTFVPVKIENGFAVYVYACQPDKVYLDQKIEVVVKHDEKNRDNTPVGNLQVFPNFNMADFLTTYLKPETVDKFALTNDEDANIQAQNEYLRDLLKEMYGQAKTSLNPQNIQQQ